MVARSRRAKGAHHRKVPVSISGDCHQVIDHHGRCPRWNVAINVHAHGDVRCRVSLNAG
jgi:hypothetical protein